VRSESTTVAACTFPRGRPSWTFQAITRWDVGGGDEHDARCPAQPPAAPAARQAQQDQRGDAP
jgi:hypothetical protein